MDAVIRVMWSQQRNIIINQQLERQGMDSPLKPLEKAVLPTH